MEQTNRTILFEELNPNRANLFTILETAKEQESLTDEEIYEIEKLFVVHSFEESLEKFQPGIYFTMERGSLNYRFTCEGNDKGTGSYVFIPVSRENRLLTLFTSMLDYKVTGKIPSQSLEKLHEYIFPREEFPRMVQLRRAVKASYVEKRFKEAEGLLDEGLELLANPLLQIQFFIHEAQSLLEAEQMQQDFIRLDEEPEMQIKILCRSSRFEKADPFLPEEEVEGFERCISAYLDGKNIAADNVVRKNLMSLSECIRKDLEGYLVAYRQALELYGNIMREYWKVFQPMLQTLLGIRSFFAQYGQVQGRMKPALLVANCTPEQMADSRRVRMLATFLETVNQKNTHANTIWYAILPRIENPAEITRRNLRERFVGTGENDAGKVNAVHDIKPVMETLAKYKVQMFLGTAATEENTFSAFAKEGMDGFYESFQPFEKINYTSYLIPCYPNFRLLLKEQAKVSAGMQFKIPDMQEQAQEQETCTVQEFRNFEKAVRLQKNHGIINPSVCGESMKNIWLTGVYVDAAYIGAGLVAAYQCVDYLNQFYQRAVDMELPGVAYRILEGDNRHRTKTVMAKEICGYSEELIKQIRAHGSGMIFASERSGVTILSDKTMAFQSGNPVSISQMQTMTYLERVIRAMTQDYKDTLIKKFFVNRQDNMMHKWMQNRTMANSLFRNEETIQYQINEQEGTCNFELRLTDSVLESKVRLSR